ncbi:MAG: hypothetical protein QNJ45_01510 [Ardenticatenaceae bacterium]|nr:hypothetical protein [Ardenticatenaceae bacterium]
MSNNTHTSPSRDWFLISIVIGIAVVVVAGLVLALRGSEPLDYVSDDDPEGVAFNYLLAIQQKDYDRAYGYLAADLPSRPADAGQFFDDLQNSWDCSSERLEQSGFRVDDSEVFTDRAVVFVEQTVFTSGDLFGSSSYTNRYTVNLIKEPAGWRINNSDQCWSFDWNSEEDS